MLLKCLCPILFELFGEMLHHMYLHSDGCGRLLWESQAYTVELEAEVNQLKEENSRLRKQQV
jgi:hypothetical protein